MVKEKICSAKRCGNLQFIGMDKGLKADCHASLIVTEPDRDDGLADWTGAPHPPAPLRGGGESKLLHSVRNDGQRSCHPEPLLRRILTCIGQDSSLCSE